MTTTPTPTAATLTDALDLIKGLVVTLNNARDYHAAGVAQHLLVQIDGTQESMKQRFPELMGESDPGT